MAANICMYNIVFVYENQALCGLFRPSPSIASDGKASFGVNLSRCRRVSWQRSNTKPRGLSASKHLRTCGDRSLAFSKILNALRSVSMSALLGSEPKPTFMTSKSLMAKTIAEFPRPMHVKSSMSPIHPSGTGS